ncbi:hypothetical protein WI27_00775 [Burkholderia cepacia]|nr:hypothetical protein WI27_00775 [Burkholderia cepacia]
MIVKFFDQRTQIFDDSVPFSTLPYLPIDSGDVLISALSGLGRFVNIPSSVKQNYCHFFVRHPLQRYLVERLLDLLHYLKRTSAMCSILKLSVIG